MGRRVIFPSLSEQHSRSCMISGWRGGYIKFFRCKTSFAFSQFRLSGELVDAMLDNGVLYLRPIWASKGEICAVLILMFFNISALSKANANVVGGLLENTIFGILTVFLFGNNSLASCMFCGGRVVVEWVVQCSYVVVIGLLCQRGSNRLSSRSDSPFHTISGFRARGVLLCGFEGSAIRKRSSL